MHTVTFYIPYLKQTFYTASPIQSLSRAKSSYVEVSLLWSLKWNWRWRFQFAGVKKTRIYVSDIWRHVSVQCFYAWRFLFTIDICFVTWISYLWLRMAVNTFRDEQNRWQFANECRKLYFKFHQLFQLTTSQHKLRQWLSTEQTIKLNLNWWLFNTKNTKCVLCPVDPYLRRHMALMCHNGLYLLRIHLFKICIMHLLSVHKENKLTIIKKTS